MSLLSIQPLVFACHSAACSPPPNGTGGSEDGAGTGSDTAGGGASLSPAELDLMFPGRHGGAGTHKTLYDDGTMSVEGLTEDGGLTTYKPATEAKLKAQWDAIGPTEAQYVANLVIAGQLAMGINPETGAVNAKDAAEGQADAVWYTTAHNDVAAITKDTGIPMDAVTAAATTLSAGRLWSGTANGNIETARALADIVANPINLKIEQRHLDLMAFRAEKSAKSTGLLGLVDNGLKPGTSSSKDLDAATLVEAMYAINTLRGHDSFEDWATKSTKDGKIGMQSTPEQTASKGEYPYFTSKGTLQVKQAVAILRGEVSPRQAISGPKYSSFYSNIANPEKAYSTTNDTWHYRVMAGNLPLTRTSNGSTRTRTMIEHSLKDYSPDGVISTAQDIFQRAGSSKSEGLASGDGMFRDTTGYTFKALSALKVSNPAQFGNMKPHEFQALIWVHYGGGKVSDSDRTAAWFGALSHMSDYAGPPQLTDKAKT